MDFDEKQDRLQLLFIYDCPHTDFGYRDTGNGNGLRRANGREGYTEDTYVCHETVKK